ncbi:MAG: hypothetical protein LBP53_00280 [Candidatus Peribacteria bacterium]|nr:hypothetical protein [Candidatus Peribacteria bacterium]
MVPAIKHHPHHPHPPHHPHHPHDDDLFALQLAILPPFSPSQFHARGPLPPKIVRFPSAHSSICVVGAVVLLVPFAVPHTPSTDLYAIQVGELFPPFTPLHVRVRDMPSASTTTGAVPAEHFSAAVDGAVVLFVPFALPHAPLIEHACVLQVSLVEIPPQPAAHTVLVAGFVQLQLVSATTEPSEALHCTVLLCVPLSVVHVLVLVPPPQLALQAHRALTVGLVALQLHRLQLFQL